MEEGGLAVSLVKEKVRRVERIWEKREKVKVEGEFLCVLGRPKWAMGKERSVLAEIELKEKCMNVSKNGS